MNPSGFDSVKMFQGNGAAHTNSLTGIEIPTPLMHGGVAPGSAIPGGVRVPELWELPLGN